MMIKSPIQLKNAEKRLAEIQKLMYENSKKYAGLDLEIQNAGLDIEEVELLDQIIEYKKLRSLPFSDAISLLFDKPILIDNIGDLLSKIRIAAKLSQSEMAERLGWKQSNLSRFENENYGSQTVNKIVEYVSELGVWLHVRPSLTEEPVGLDKGAWRAKPYNVGTRDITATSTEHLADNTAESTFTRKNISTISDMSEVSSV